MADRSALWPHPGAILCGGGSTRMGAPKHDLVLPDGRTMIETVAQVVGEVCASLIILGPADVLPDLPHVPDLREGQGPLAGIEALLASGISDRYLVVPCDVPRVARDLLRRLVDAPAAPIAAFRVEGGEHPESLPLRIESDALPIARRLLDEGRRAVHTLFGEVEITLESLMPEESDRLTNVNTPDDWATLQ